MADWRGERLAEIRQIIHEADPQVVEDWMWRGAPVWSNLSMHAVANAHKGKVKLTFLHGANLKGPKRLFNAGFGGATWRAIDVFEGDKVDRRGLNALLKEAVEFNASNRVAKSRGSRAQFIAG